MKKRSGIDYLLLATAVAFFTLSCVASPKAENMSKNGITIQAIKDNPDLYAGMTVRLTGRFKGWKGSCQGSPPKSRSDWMIADDTGCMYVSGRVPKGLQPMFPEDESIELTGVVRLTRFGGPYLEVRSPR
jgi:hypothetical protein